MISKPLRVLSGARVAVSFAIAVSALAASPCRAQLGPDAYSSSSGDTFSSGPAITGYQTDVVNAGPAPVLQGATNGTIGPPAGDVTIIQGINTAGRYVPGDAFSPPRWIPDREWQYEFEPEPELEFVAVEEAADDEALFLPAFPTEVVREDPRGLDLPDSFGDAVRDVYARQVAEFEGKRKTAADRADICVEVGIAYANLGRVSEALACLKRARKLDPRCDAAYYNEGTIYSNQGRYVEALKSYNKALSLNASSRAYFHLGFTYGVIGLPQMAVHAYDKAIALDGRDGKTLFERAVCKMQLGLNADAVSDLDRALDKTSPRAAWVFQRGLAKARAERYEEALVDLGGALRLDDVACYYNERGKVFLKMKEYNAALYDFNEALHRRSTYKEALENRAEVYAKMGRPGPSVDDLVAARRLPG